MWKKKFLAPFALYSFFAFWQQCQPQVFWKRTPEALGGFIHSSGQHLSAGKGRCAVLLQVSPVMFKSDLGLKGTCRHVPNHSVDILASSLGPLSCWRMDRCPRDQERLGAGFIREVHPCIPPSVLTSLPVPTAYSNACDSDVHLISLFHFW